MTRSSGSTPERRRELSEREAGSVDRKEAAREARIQDEPESTIGKKPGELEHSESAQHGVARSGAALWREEGDEGEAAAEIRERERDDPSIAPDE
jgi:hypothetical protein